MITYQEVVMRLFELQDESYRQFHKKLLHADHVNVIGVRMPLLRKLAKEWKGLHDEFLRFPDEYYEVTTLKCMLVGALPYEAFCARVDGVVALLDNWATCDCFTAPCIKKNRASFLPRIEGYLNSGREFVVRYALVTLLHDYMTEEYLPFIFRAVEACDCAQYYIHMAAAWLIAETLVRFYDRGTAFLRQTTLPKQTRNKAIQKARESYRLTAEQKERLLQMKA